MLVNAQVINKVPEQRANQMTKVLQKKLNLSSDQATQIHATLLNQATRMDSLNNNLSPNKRSNSLTRRIILMQAKRQIFSVLTDEQRKQFIQLEKIKKEKQDERKERKSTVQG